MVEEQQAAANRAKKRLDRAEENLKLAARRFYLRGGTAKQLVESTRMNALLSAGDEETARGRRAQLPPA